jgi:hypothetical protein
MIEFAGPRGVGRKVRMWRDELPAGAAFEPSGPPVAATLAVDPSVAVACTRAAVEMFQPRGASFGYGLLGAELSASVGGELHVVVPTGPSSAGPYLDSLAGHLDTVTVGSTREYADAIVAGIREAQAAFKRLPGGRLTVVCMAHGAVGSSPAVFRALAKAAVRLLVRGGMPQTADEAAALLD